MIHFPSSVVKNNQAVFGRIKVEEKRSLPSRIHRSSGFKEQANLSVRWINREKTEDL